MSRTLWTTRAACRGADPRHFFPDGPGRAAGPHVRWAKRVCAGCPVREECLAEAMRLERRAEAHFRFGVYGGLTPRERHRLYLQLARAAAVGGGA